MKVSNSLLDWLLHTYVGGDDGLARGALDLMAGSSDPKLVWTTVPAWPHTASVASLGRRQSFEALFAFHCFIEIGCLVGLIDAALPSDLRESLRRQLDHQAVYARRLQYPMLLQELLRRRTEGSPLTIRVSRDEGEYYRLLRLSSLLQPTSSTVPSDLTVFSSVVEGHAHESWPTELMIAIGQPNRVATALEVANSEHEFDLLTRAINGFDRLMTFTLEFDAFLDTVDDAFAAACYWYSQQYWYEYVKREVIAILEAVLEGLDRDGSQAELIRGALGRVTSGRYNWPLYELAIMEGDIAPRLDAPTGSLSREASAQVFRDFEWSDELIASWQSVLPKGNPSAARSRRTLTLSPRRGPRFVQMWDVNVEPIEIQKARTIRSDED